jgi:STAS-like domain of unknown function (DUF4325)
MQMEDKAEFEGKDVELDFKGVEVFATVFLTLL